MSEPIRAGVLPERWARLSFDDQLGNLGTDVSRAVTALAAGDSERASMWAAHARAEFEMTIADPRWPDDPVVLEQRRCFEAVVAGDEEADPTRFDQVFMPYAIRSNEARRATDARR